MVVIFFVKVNFEIQIGAGRYGQGLYLGCVPKSACQSYSIWGLDI